MDDYSATVAVPPDGSEATITVTGAMTLEHAAAIKEHLVQGLDCAQQVALDLRGVTRIDLTGLQFICALHRDAAARGKHLRLRGWQREEIVGTRSLAGFQEDVKCCSDLPQSCLWCADAENAGEGA